MTLEKSFYRGIVSMVAHRSPKPPVRVRILLPLPIFIRGDFIFNTVKKFILIFIFSIFFICIFFIPSIHAGYSFSTFPNNSEIIDFNPDGFVWPIPGYTRISSYFGKRISPTSGASSTHSGIDIPAPPGTKLIAVADGTITFRQFLGAGGYTITLSFDNMKISYCQCDPNFIVNVGER